MVEYFIQCVGIYPAGTLVLLDSEEIGIVCAVNSEKLLRPNVMLIYRDSNTRYPQPFIVDLSETREDPGWVKRSIVMPLDSRQWNIHIDDFMNIWKKGGQNSVPQEKNA